MNRPNSHQMRLLSLLGPALSITLVYYLIFQLPMLRRAAGESAKLHRLSVRVSPSDDDLNTQRISQLRDEVRGLTTQAESDRRNRTHLVAQRSELNRTLLRSQLPATNLAKTIDLLERNGLQCISTQPTEQSQSQLPDALHAIAGVPSKAPTARERSGELQIEILGTFAEMRQALQEMKAEPSQIRLVSLEMSSVDYQTEIRSWRMTVGLGSSGR